jgi:hypothetical protein
MVEIVENGKKLVLKLSENLGSVSEYKEWINEVKNANVKKIKTKLDRYPFPLYAETTYEIEAISDNAEIEITIRDDNQNNDSYHYDYMYFKYNGQKWESEYKPNSNYH